MWEISGRAADFILLVAFDCLIKLTLTIPTTIYMNRSLFCAESHVSLSGVTCHSESEMSPHKTTCHLGEASLQACP